ncbi:hypothetical protein ACTHTV_14890, partial [Neisseria sp. P0015.S010]
RAQVGEPNFKSLNFCSGFFTSIRNDRSFPKKALNPHKTFAKASICQTGTPCALPASFGEQAQTARNLFSVRFQAVSFFE